MPFLTVHMACQNKMDGLYPCSINSRSRSRQTVAFNPCPRLLRHSSTARAYVYRVCRNGIQAHSQMHCGSCGKTSRRARLHHSSCGTILLIPPMQERPTKQCQFVFIRQGCWFRELLLLIFHSWKYPSCVTTNPLIRCFFFFQKRFLLQHINKWRFTKWNHHNWK